MEHVFIVMKQKIFLYKMEFANNVAWNNVLTVPTLPHAKSATKPTISFYKMEFANNVAWNNVLTVPTLPHARSATKQIIFTLMIIFNAPNVLKDVYSASILHIAHFVTLKINISLLKAILLVNYVTYPVALIVRI